MLETLASRLLNPEQCLAYGEVVCTPRLSGQRLSLEDARRELRERCSVSAKFFWDRAVCVRCEESVTVEKRLYRVCNAPFPEVHLVCGRCISGSSRPGCKESCKCPPLQKLEEQPAEGQLAYWQMECEVCPLCTDSTLRTVKGLRDHVETECVAVASERVDMDVRTLEGTLRRLHSRWMERLKNREEIAVVVQEAIQKEAERHQASIAELQGRLGEVTKEKDALQGQLGETTKERDALDCRRKELLKVSTNQQSELRELRAANPPAKVHKLRRLETEKFQLQSQLEESRQDRIRVITKREREIEQLRVENDRLRLLASNQEKIVQGLYSDNQGLHAELMKKGDALKRRGPEPLQSKDCKASRRS